VPFEFEKEQDIPDENYECAAVVLGAVAGLDHDDTGSHGHGHDSLWWWCARSVTGSVGGEARMQHSSFSNALPRQDTEVAQ
jgi:hypothetical protein